MTEGVPLLSIVTATYNDADRLRHTLTSIERQGGKAKGVEIVIVDGSSTDDTSAAITRYPSLHPIYICEPDGGVYDAMNKGWRRSTGRYVQFLNAGDSFASPSSLATLLAALETCRVPWLVAGARHLHGGKRPPSTIRNMPHVWWRHAAGLQPHCHQSTIFARPVLELLEGYCLGFDFVADFDLILRCGLIAPPAEIVEILVVYEGGGMSAKRHDEIAMLLHQVRVARLELSGAAVWLDWLWARWRKLRLAAGKAHHSENVLDQSTKGSERRITESRQLSGPHRRHKSE